MSIRMRHTRGHVGNRRSHHALKGVAVIKDADSGALRLPHRLDETTGVYRGKQIFEPKRKEARIKQSSGTHHEHVHKTLAETKGSKGIAGKMIGDARPKSRSGMGGQAG